MVKVLVKRILRYAKPVAERVFGFEASVARKWARNAHRRLFLAQWGLAPYPEWFDHDLDLYFQWQKSGDPMWLERGVFSSLGIEEGAEVLDICCGDGFYSANFYALKASRVIGCDFDRRAIKAAMRRHKRTNISFIEADVRKNLPSGIYDNVIWDAAIEHFLPEEIESLLLTIKTRMQTKSLLSGYTILERPDGVKSLEQHEYEFHSREELANFLAPHFNFVRVLETSCPTRQNLYFWASDDLSRIPFSSDWSREFVTEVGI